MINQVPSTHTGVSYGPGIFGLGRRTPFRGPYKNNFTILLGVNDNKKHMHRGICGGITVYFYTTNVLERVVREDYGRFGSRLERVSQRVVCQADVVLVDPP